MNKSDIKGIPQCVRAEIKRLDPKMLNLYGRNVVRFYYYIGELKNGELAKYTVATKTNPKNGKLMMKQVAVRDKTTIYANDMVYNYLAGYQVEWEQEIQTGKQHVYWNNVTNHDIKWDPYGTIINKASLENTKYKYSGYQYAYGDIYKYLQIWEKHPGVEFLAKSGLGYLVDSKKIIKKCEKDKKFCKFLYNNKEFISKEFPRIISITKAYKMNASIEMIDLYYSMRNRYDYLKFIDDNEAEKILQYIVNKCDANFAAYNDYLKACNYLKLDMNEPKNKYPHDFRRWHDMRIDQYTTRRDKKLNDKMIKVATKYLPMETNSKYCVIIAKSKMDLIHEGDALHHCVGSMNYDKRMVDEESLIFFVRENRTTPYVTVEYSLKEKKVLQCYADHDSRPEQPVIDFVYKDWEKYATKQLNKIKKVA